MSEEEEKGKVIELFERNPFGSVDRLKRQWVDGLIRIAHGNNRIEADKAVAELVAIRGFDPVPHLVSVLRSARTARARAEAAKRLGGFGTDEVIQELASCVMSGVCRLSSLLAARSLVKLYRPDRELIRFTLLMLALDAPREGARLEALRVLLVRNDARAPKAAAHALGDTSRHVRMLAKRWLLVCDRGDIERELHLVWQRRRNEPFVREGIVEIMRARWPDIKKDPD